MIWVKTWFKTVNKTKFNFVQLVLIKLTVFIHRKNLKPGCEAHHTSYIFMQKSCIIFASMFGIGRVQREH